jgi:hypothetical protein
MDINIYLEENRMESFVDDFKDALKPVENMDGKNVANAVNVADKLITDIDSAYNI